jgi:hypothetical protein
LIAAQRAERPPAPKAHTESLERLALWPKLDHQLGVNDFFCTLAAHRNPARLREAGRDGEVSGLTQWWSERRCTEFFWKYQGAGRETRLRPDGYGCWEEAGRVVRFFLEHDTGTESLAKVTGKLDDYCDFPTDAFGVLLFSVHSPRREIALRAALHRALAGHDPGFVIATAARDPHSTYGHPDGPAGPIWGLWTPRSGESVSRRYPIGRTAPTRPLRRAQRLEHRPAVERGGVRPGRPGDVAPHPHSSARTSPPSGLCGRRGRPRRRDALRRRGR